MHMITCTLDRWTRGGLCDHLGGGFHRYSVDEKFHYPHFEKMLYDQPQMVRVLLAAWQIIGNGRFVDAARGTLDYLLREMRSEAGGLYSAQVRARAFQLARRFCSSLKLFLFGFFCNGIAGGLPFFLSICKLKAWEMSIYSQFLLSANINLYMNP